MARRVLPKDISAPIYSLLERLESLLLRQSLPFPPYGLRIGEGKDVSFPSLPDQAAQYLSIGHYCKTWDDDLRREKFLLTDGPKTKLGKFGTIIKVPLAARQLCEFYEVKWESKFGTVELDQLLRGSSRR
jgi:hypothetical protein